MQSLVEKCFLIDGNDCFPVPSRIVSISPSQGAKLGCTVTLICIATGRPTPRVMWKKNDRVLLEGQSSVNITISNILQANGGVYECFATNILANDMEITTINIEGKNVKVLYDEYINIMPLVKMESLDKNFY